MPKVLPSVADIHTIAFDFDGVFTDNKVWFDQDGRESVRCDRADGLAFDMLRAFRVEKKLYADFFILSKEINPVVLARAQKLKLDCYHGIGDKLSFMQAYLTKRFPSNPKPFSGVIYLGNDLNDLALMKQSGYSVAPGDAHPKIRQTADLVLEQRGGEGFVRAFVERLLDIDQLTEGEIHELVSNC